MAIVTVVDVVAVVAVVVVVAVVSRGIALCGLPWDHIVQIALWDRIPVSTALYVADRRRNVAKEEGSIVRNGNYLCALLYEREGTLYRKPTFSYVNSRNCSVESPRGIRVDCKHIAIPIVGKPVSSTVTAN